MNRNQPPPGLLNLGAMPPGQPRVQVGINELVGLHSYLSTLTKDQNISAELNTAKLQLETHIIHFISELKSGPQQ